jgi:hypothetical protein
VSGDGHRWEVSWLPGRYMSRDKAVTAMVLADTIGAGGMHGRHPMWIHVEGWAAELGMTAPDVLTRTASPPEWAKDGESAQPADPEAGG